MTIEGEPSIYDELEALVPERCHGCNSEAIITIGLGNRVVNEEISSDLAKQITEEYFGACWRGLTKITDEDGNVVRKHCGKYGAPCSMGAPLSAYPSEY